MSEKIENVNESAALSGITSTTLFADFVRKHNLAVEHLTETQLADAIRQAIAAGDFIRYVHADKQMVVYVPFNEVSRLRLQYNELLMAVGNKYDGETRHETALRYIQEAERGSDEACAANDKDQAPGLSGLPASDCSQFNSTKEDNL